MAEFAAWDEEKARCVMAEKASSQGAALPMLYALQAVFGCIPLEAEQTRRTENVVWHAEDLLEIHPHDAEEPGVRDGDWIRLNSRAGETTLRAKVTERVAPGVVYTFHHPTTQANVVTTEYLDWATNCPEYKVTAVQISPSNGPSEWQVAYEAMAAERRRIDAVPAVE